MSYKMVTDSPGQVAVSPRTVRIYSTDSYATVTAAGYISNSNIQDGQLKPTDIIVMNYGGTPPTTTGIFLPTFSAAGVITLSLLPGTNPITTAAGNLAEFSNTEGDLVDSEIVANLVLQTSIVNPDVNINLVRFNTTVVFSDIDGGDPKELFPSSGTKQYQIVNLWANRGGVNFAGGDKLMSIGDGTTVYSLIPAASLQTLANAGWGATALPYPASAAINTPTAAGAALVARASGGATDYTSGSVVISGILMRVG